MSAAEIITLPFDADYNAPTSEDNCDQFNAAIPRYFIEEFSKTGERVFDPFIGFGTTAFACEALKRVPYGIEADGERFEWAAGQLKHWQNIRHGDAADTAEFDFPAMDLCVTSPPFMPMSDDWNPLYGGDPAHDGYDQYLTRMGEIFATVKTVMKNGAHVIVHCDDVLDEHGQITPLKNDLRDVIENNFSFIKETHITWTNAPADFPQTHCLIFENCTP